MSNPFFDHPILNSPYECPQRHWELDVHGQPTQKIIETRRRADFITVHLHLSPRTRGLIGSADLALMKPTAYFINTSRGPIVEEAALLDVLRNKRIAGAGLDVYDVEPLSLDHPYRKLDNAVITPHLGYVTEDNYRHFYGQMVEDIRAFLAGKPVRVIKAK